MAGSLVDTSNWQSFGTALAAIAAAIAGFLGYRKIRSSPVEEAEEQAEEQMLHFRMKATFLERITVALEASADADRAKLKVLMEQCEYQKELTQMARGWQVEREVEREVIKRLAEKARLQ